MLGAVHIRHGLCPEQLTVACARIREALLLTEVLWGPMSNLPAFYRLCYIAACALLSERAGTPNGYIPPTVSTEIENGCTVFLVVCSHSHPQLVISTACDTLSTVGVAQLVVGAGCAQVAAFIWQLEKNPKNATH